MLRRAQVSPEFKERVLHVLSSRGYELSRGAKMSQEEILNLLAAFNAEGIHFA